MATTEQDTTPEAPAKQATTRTYVVLGKSDDRAGTWLEVGTADAFSDLAAIGKVAGDDEAGTWVAIPERSWNPRTRELEPQPPKAVWS